MGLTALRIDDEPGVEHFADELKPGARLLLGQFTIDAFLNAGGFGITYRARDSLDRRVVVKECFPSSFCRRTGQNVGPRSRQREEEFRSLVALFQQEALNLSKLDHPNIVKVHQVFEDNQTAYMAMEHIDGPDLLETLEGTAPRLPREALIAALHQLLDALGYVHAQGFLHRDISPDNILIDRTTGRPVLIDFGAAKKEVTRKSRAVSGLRVVKDGYSPQEFYISGSKQGPHSDLYALAATFCHLVSGQAPRTSQERLAAIANGEGDPQPPLAGRVKGYPRAFLASIDKAMSVFPKDRMQLAAEWQAALAEPGAQPLTVVPVAAAQLRAATGAGTGRGRWLAAAVGLLALGLGFGLAALPRAEAPVPDSAAPAAASALAPAAPQAPTLTEARAILLPYLPDPADATLIAARLPGSPDWVQPGQRVVEVNNLPVADAASLRAALDALADPAAQAEAVNVVFGLAGATDGAPLYQMARLPVVEELRRSDGLVVAFQPGALGPRTATVTALPPGGAGALRLGDVLLADAERGLFVTGPADLRTILLRESPKSDATYGFTVLRDDGMAVVTLTPGRAS
jgi:hypothetical protein